MKDLLGIKPTPEQRAPYVHVIDERRIREIAHEEVCLKQMRSIGTVPDGCERYDYTQGSVRP